MKRICLSIYSLLLVAAAFSQQTVDPYLELAAENNPGLKASFNNYLVAMERIPQAESLPDPQVAFGFFIQPVETRVGPQRATLAVSQAFPWFGTLKSQGNAAAKMAEAKLSQFENEKSRLYRDIRIAYNQLYFIRQAIRLTKENLELLSSFKELARVSFESGNTGFVSVLRAEMEEQELIAKLELLEDSWTTAYVDFESLINTTLEEEIVLPDTLEQETFLVEKQVLLDSIVANNPYLISLQYQEMAKEEQVKVAQLRSRPSFTIGASYVNISERTDMDVAGNGRDAFIFPQVGLKIPLYRKKYTAMQKQANLEKEGIQHLSESYTNELGTRLEIYVKDYIDAKRRLSLYNNLLVLADRSLSLLQTEFITGKLDFEEVLRMERKLLSYKLELERARVDNNNAICNINNLTGK